MSVPPGDRSRSSMQFVETADQIEKRAMEVCRRWPKSWTFYITQRTVALASEIYEQALRANAIYPLTTEREREQRLAALHAALGANYAFARKIERAYSLFPICGERQKDTPAATQRKSMDVLQEFMRMCAVEDDALRGNISFTRKIALAAKEDKKNTDQ